MALSRREFLAWGVASGAVAAAGIVVPVAILAEDDETADGTATPAPTTTPAVVTLYPRSRVASLSALSGPTEIAFNYPTEGTPASLFKLGKPAAGGVGPDTDIVAYTTACTHMGCPLGGQFNTEHGLLGPCGCHFTTFDLALRGQVVIGQATEDLPQVLLEIEGDDIIAVGTMGIAYGFRDNLADAVVVEGL